MEPASTRLDDLPAPSAELVLVRVLTEAHLATLSRKRAMEFLRIASETLASEESLVGLFPIRPQSEHAATSKARREAVAMFKALLPVLLARVSRD